MKWRKYHLVELLTPDLAQVLALASKRNMDLYELEQQDGIVHRMKIRPGDLGTLGEICRKTGSNYRLLRQASHLRILKNACDRPVLILGILFLVVLTWLLPRRVLFLQVECNGKIPISRILEAAEKSGLSFGVSTREVRSERVKNSLLELLPQLQWAGVNLRGAVAVIQVRERESSSSPEEETGVGHIVAARDGVITQCTAYRGNLLCSPGQAVTEGQLLISGFTDTGLVIRAEQAGGEVFALTKRNLELILPREMEGKCPEREEYHRISLRIGKKRINLWKNSGISSTICDRMYKEYYVTLPGGFTLPGALVVETFQPFSVSPAQIPEEIAGMLLEEFAEGYLRQLMNAGTIQDSSLRLRFSDQAAYLAGEYHCMEMIGKMQRLEIGEKDE